MFKKGIPRDADAAASFAFSGKRIKRYIKKFEITCILIYWPNCDFGGVKRVKKKKMRARI